MDLACFEFQDVKSLPRLLNQTSGQSETAQTWRTSKGASGSTREELGSNVLKDCYGAKSNLDSFPLTIDAVDQPRHVRCLNLVSLV